MTKGMKILTIEDPKEEKILREKSTSVQEKELKNKEFQQFLDDLLQTAIESEEPAGGLASPQVGILKRVFYILNYDTDKWELFINPIVEPVGFKKKAIAEACLSIPNREGKVERNYRVKVKYIDRYGNRKTKKYEDLNAISIQHENDHLEGILFTDKILEE
jgi:peptide deformylase